MFNPVQVEFLPRLKSWDSLSKDLEDLGMDDLYRGDFFNHLEKNFEIEISDEEASSCDTLRDVVEYLENNL